MFNPHDLKHGQLPVIGEYEEDKGWMVKIMQSWSYTVGHFDQTREMIGSTPWHGENPGECDIINLSVCCKLAKYHKGHYLGPNYYPGPKYPLWLRSVKPNPKPIEILMREGGCVFSDAKQQIWVQLTETEFKDSFSGKHKREAIHEYMEKDSLKRVDPRTPLHMSGMTPFNEYRSCAVTSEGLVPDPELASKFYTEEAGKMNGGTRAQKKHKSKSKCKTKSKRKSKTKSKCKTKSKTK